MQEYLGSKGIPRDTIDTLFHNGCVSLDDVQLIDAEMLDSMRIYKPFDRKKLLALKNEIIPPSAKYQEIVTLFVNAKILQELAQKYAYALTREGFDSPEKIANITDGDLAHCGITSRFDVRIIAGLKNQMATTHGRRASFAPLSAPVASFDNSGFSSAQSAANVIPAIVAKPSQQPKQAAAPAAEENAPAAGNGFLSAADVERLQREEDQAIQEEKKEQEKRANAEAEAAASAASAAAAAARAQEEAEMEAARAQQEAEAAQAEAARAQAEADAQAEAEVAAAEARAQADAEAAQAETAARAQEAEAEAARAQAEAEASAEAARQEAEAAAEAARQEAEAAQAEAAARAQEAEEAAARAQAEAEAQAAAAAAAAAEEEAAAAAARAQAEAQAEADAVAARAQADAEAEAAAARALADAQAAAAEAHAAQEAAEDARRASEPRVKFKDNLVEEHGMGHTESEMM